MQISDFIMAEWPLFLGLIIISAMLARSFISGGKIKGVRPLEAIQLINHQDALVVDVRTDKEFNDGHILDAVHLPLGVLQNRLGEIEAFKNQPIVVACRSGARSSQACGILNSQGFAQVYNLSGGVLAWQSANMPLTTAKSKPPKAPVPAAVEETAAAEAPAIEPQESAAESIETVETVETMGTGASPEPAQSASAEIVIYTTMLCPYCTRAKKLLESKGVAFREVGINGKAELRDEMEARAKSSSTPQIFIGEHHVGGCDELYALDKEGKLDQLLGLQAQP